MVQNLSRVTLRPLLLAFTVSVSFADQSADSQDLDIPEITLPGEYRPAPSNPEPPQKAISIEFDERLNHELNFGNLNVEDKQRYANLPRTGPTPIGIHREPTAEQATDLMKNIKWQQTDGGWAGTVTVRSAKAENVRLNLDVQSSSPIELTFFGFNDLGEPSVIERLQAGGIEKSSLWSPSVSGQVIGLEVRVTDAQVRENITLNIVKLSHGLDASRGEAIQQEHLLPSRAQPNDQSACENEHVACHDSAIPSNLEDAAVRLRYESGSATYVCSGTVVNDTAPGSRPFIVTAEHCISNSAIAATVESRFFYQYTQCTAQTLDARVRDVAGGADLLATNVQHDVALIRLKRNAPHGALYAGWSTAQSNYQIGNTHFSIHHPHGQHKRYYRGGYLGTTEVNVCDSDGQNCITRRNRSLLRFQVGISQSGSSGAGIFMGSNLIAVHSASNTGKTCIGTGIGGQLRYVSSQLTPHLNPPSTGPVVAFGSTTSAVAENVGTVDVPISLSNSPSSPISVNYQVGGSAKAGSDFTSLSGSVTVAANKTSASISISITNDGVDEGEETIILTLQSGSGYTLGTQKTHTISINDRITDPTNVSLSVSPTSINEGDGATRVTVTATIVGASRWTEAKQISVSASGSGRTNVVDFSPIRNFNIRIPANGSSGSSSFLLYPTDDANAENKEVVTFSGTLANVTVASATLELLDNDSSTPVTPPEVSFTSTSSSVAENIGTKNVTISLSKAAPSSITINYQVRGTATAASDYASLSGSLGVSAGQTSATIPVSITNDVIDEPNETIELTILSDANYQVGSISKHTLTITDNDATPNNIALSLTPTAISEGDGATTVRVTATIVGATRWQDAKTIVVSASGSGKANSVDFSAISKFNIQIPATQNSGYSDITVTPTDDNSDENNETITFSATLSNVTVSNALLFLLDDDDPPPVTPPVVIFNSASASVAENAGTINVAISLSKAPPSSISINYRVRGTATTGSDFFRLSGSLSVSANQTSTSIPISITNDVIDEPNETIELTILSGTNYSVGSSSTHTLTIRDDDAAPANVALSLSPTTLGEGDGATSVRISATIVGTTRWPDARTIVVSAAGSGSANAVDFSPISNVNVQIPATRDSGYSDITVQPTDDDNQESSETITFSGTLSNVTVSSASLTLTDDDAPVQVNAPVVNFSSASASVPEAIGTRGVEISLSPGTSSAITINYRVTGSASAGRDFSGLLGALTVPANHTSATLSVSITNDVINEPDETIELSLLSRSNYQVGSVSTHTLTIRDNDVAPSNVALSVVPSAIGEPDSPTTVRVSASIVGPTRWADSRSIAVSASGSGTSNVVDFSPISNFGVRIPPEGNLGFTDITVRTIDDAIQESNERITFAGTLTNTTVSNAILTLIDDDTPTQTNLPVVGFSSVTTNLAESSGNSIVDLNISPTPQDAIDIFYNILGSASPVLDYTGLTGVVRVNANTSRASISLFIVDDVLDESNENIVLELVNGSAYDVGRVRTHTLTIVDDDAGTDPTPPNDPPEPDDPPEPPTPPPEPQDDHGDSREFATRVAASSETAGILERSGDLDYFTFRIDEHNNISIYTTGNTDTICQFEGEEIDPIQNDDGPSNRNCLIETAQRNGAYWVTVRGYSSATGSYSLHIESASSDISDDPDNPHELELNSSFSSHIDHAGDTDYYGINVKDAGFLTVYSQGETDTVGCIRVVHPEQEKMQWLCDDDSGVEKNLHHQIEAEDESEFLISVEGHDNATGDYTIVNEFKPSQERHKRFENAALLSSDTDNWQVQTMAEISESEPSYYRLELAHASQVAVESTGDLDLQATLYHALDPETPILQASDGGKQQNFRFETNMEAGMYYLLVSGGSDQSNATYSLSIKVSIEAELADANEI